MAPSSLSSLYLSQSHHHQANPFPSLIPKPTFARLPLRPQTLAFSSKPSAQNQNQNPNQNQNQNQTQKLNSSQPDKKSFASRKDANAVPETGFLRDRPRGASVNGVVIEGEIEPAVIWEQRIQDVEAEQKRRVATSPGFSFSAAGLLFPYHLGVAQFLVDKGYIKETTPLAGSSAGAITCAVIASGASMEEAFMATKVLADDCRRRGTAFRLGAVLRDLLDKYLPKDAHTRSNGRVRIAITQILWGPSSLLVDQFDSKEDLINAVLASSFIPGYTAPQPATLFRNRLCIDGALTMFMPPTSAAQTVHVCAFPATELGLQGIGISPDCNPENRGSPIEVFNWALKPAEDDILDRLFEFGHLDAAVWAEENPVAEVVEDDSA